MADYVAKKADLAAKIVLWKETVARIESKIQAAQAMIVKCDAEIAKVKKS